MKEELEKRIRDIEGEYREYYWTSKYRMILKNRLKFLKRLYRSLYLAIPSHTPS